MKDGDDIPGFDRRTVLKSTAVAAVGVGVFSGTASANVPEQLNFCGCTQVCVCDNVPDEGKNNVGNYQVVIAKEPYEADDFEVVDTADQGGQFCYELSEEQLEEGYKVVAVREGRGGGEPGSGGEKRTRVCVGDDPQRLYTNPGTCAQKALAVLKEDFCEGDPELRFDDPDVTIVQGRCGKPCRNIPGKGTPGGGQDQNRD